MKRHKGDKTGYCLIKSISCWFHFCTLKETILLSSTCRYLEKECRQSISQWTTTLGGDVFSNASLVNQILAKITKHYHLAKLTHLSISGCTLVRRQYLVDTVQMNSLTLQHLDLSACRKLTDQILITLSQLPTQLRVINVRNCRLLSDKGLIPLIVRSSPCLQELDLKNTQVSDACMTEAICQCHGLTTLMLGYEKNGINPRVENEIVRFLSDVSLDSVAKNCLKIEVLDVGGRCLVSGSGILALKKLNLKRLNLSRVVISDQELIKICHSEEFKSNPWKSLTMLDMSCINANLLYGISDNGLTFFFKGLCSIKFLDLSANQDISDNSIFDIVQCCGNELEELYLSRTSVSWVGVWHIGEHCPGLQKLAISRCRKLTKFKSKIRSFKEEFRISSIIGNLCDDEKEWW